MADVETRQKVVSFARALPVAHRVVIGVAVALLILSAYAFMRWVSAPSYAVAAAGLSGSEISEVTNALDSNGISYRLEDGGTRVMVPRSMLSEAKSAMGREGINLGDASTKTGQSELNGAGLGVSSDIQDLRIRQALETDLERSLENFDFVKRADVALVVPQRSLFEESQQPVTATILLNTLQYPLQEQITALVFAVSQSVEGLNPDQITVNDFSGNILHAPSIEGAIPDAQDNALMERNVEATLQAKVYSLLADIGVGPQATVVVNATIDFDETTIESITNDKESSVVLREEISNETFNSADGAAGGVPGVDGGEITVDADGAFVYENARAVTEYGVNQVVTSTVKAKGDIEKLSIAITIDDGTVTGGTVPTPDIVQSLVVAGIGIDLTRGDTIAVEAFPFQVLEELEGGSSSISAFGAPAEELDLFALIGQAVGALVLVLVTVALFLLTRKQAEEEEELEEIALELEATKRNTPQLTQAEVDAKASREEVLDMVRHQPEEIALLLRGWLTDR